MVELLNKILTTVWQEGNGILRPRPLQCVFFQSKFLFFKNIHVYNNNNNNNNWKVMISEFFQMQGTGADLTELASKPQKECCHVNE